MRKEVKYSTFKSTVNDRDLLHYFIEDDGYYYLAAETGLFEMECRVEKDTADATDYETNLKSGANQSASRAINIEGTHATNLLKAVPVSNIGREGSGTVVVSHNFCDKTTWYTDSTKIIDQAMTDSGNGLRFTSNVKNWVDLTHGKMFREDKVNALGEYTVVVNVNGSDLDYEDGYTVDYDIGEILFDSDQTGNTVLATFYRADSSEFVIEPGLNKILVIEHTEVQFTSDADMNYSHPMHFETWVFGGLYDMIKYKTPWDIIDESNLGYHVPKFGSMTQDITIFPFNYVTVKDVRASLSTQIKIRIGGEADTDGIDKAMVGTKGTVTFYCLSKDET